jgi:hypothetical protein
MPSQFVVEHVYTCALHFREFSQGRDLRKPFGQPIKTRESGARAVLGCIALAACNIAWLWAAAARAARRARSLRRRRPVAITTESPMSAVSLQPPPAVGSSGSCRVARVHVPTRCRLTYRTGPGMRQTKSSCEAPLEQIQARAPADYIIRGATPSWRDLLA